MICRHFIAPQRAFTQLSNEIIRHPRLSSDAVRLLTWQLSLPEGATESLSRTADRANIGATAFTRAKRQLVAEGFVHERRVQVAAGRWITQQLVSSTPLNEAEAYKVLGARPLITGEAQTMTERVTPQVAPSARNPAVGEPTGRGTDGLSIPRHQWETPSNHPAGQGQRPGAVPQVRPRSEEDAAPRPVRDALADALADALTTTLTAAPPTNPPSATEVPSAADTPDAPDAAGTDPADDTDLSVVERARRFVAALPDLSPDLRHIPHGMTKELVFLANCWLRMGHSESDIRTHILRSLPVDGTRIHSPGGFLRYVLRDVPPVRPGPRPAEQAAATRPDTAVPGSRLSARLAGTRECEGDHAQVRLFRPVGDETRCRDCLTSTGRTASA